VQKSTFCNSSRVVWLQEWVNSEFCLYDSISGYNEKGKEAHFNLRHVSKTVGFATFMCWTAKSVSNHGQVFNIRHYQPNER